MQHAVCEQKMKSDYPVCCLSNPEFSRNFPLAELHLALPRAECTVHHVEISLCLDQIIYLTSVGYNRC